MTLTVYRNLEDPGQPRIEWIDASKGFSRGIKKLRLELLPKFLKWKFDLKQFREVYLKPSYLVDIRLKNIFF